MPTASPFASTPSRPTPPTGADGPAIAGAGLTARHRRRLRDVYRSAGWPCQDLLEIELLAEGLIERLRSPLGHETLRVTEAGVAILADTLRRNRARRDPHEGLVERVAREMTRAGRIAWRGLSLRAPVDGRWAMSMPDVYSVRDTTVEAYLCPIVHEVKVHRADLLSDLRSQQKRAAYLALSSECWYALRDGIARPEEIPLDFGVLVERAGTGFEVARPAPKRPMRMPFGLWMALAKATPVEGWRQGEEQACLGEDPDAANGPAWAPADAASTGPEPSAQGAAPVLRPPPPPLFPTIDDTR